MTVLATGFLVASAAVSALQQALDAAADWTMERRFPGSSRVLASAGEVRCEKGKGIVWKVLMPFVSSVSMTPTAMIFEDEDGRREKSLDDLPHYEAVREATDAFAAGKTEAFDGLFEVAETPVGTNGWRLVLRPEVSAMKRLFVEIELTGNVLPTNAVLRTADGGVTSIRFKELPHVR